ncbi:MAG TPA: formate dehydrogenase subunit gamma [Thauera sp.]|uniref:formate dehydrogenase subunit gamma n=1 Tax=Thauera sp. WB-2 TaxID=2897772 RepID=UPI0022DCFE88|nr:formate dehydrogenase subunit gamma [Thauera sp. WB-2]WBL64876.1 formate dehydrogenase subunit gamma [Thauera sp. WB-2]HRJ23301.1 formate dehydrogenase subunit gamma [Thauera sp.]
MTIRMMRAQGGGFAALLLMLLLWAFALPLHAAERPAGSSAADQAERQVERPLNNAPVWRAVRSGEVHTTNVRGPEAGVLIQSEGNTWRQLRNGPITQYGGWLLILVPSAIVLFWLVKGTIRLHQPRTGRLMKRFSAFERFIHWGTAITFLVLAVTGLAILFGKHVLLPIFGHGVLAALLDVGKTVHNYVGPAFGVFVVLMILTFLRDNVWQAIDAVWIRRAGGVLDGSHVPSGRFNFGEKTWFWIGVTFLGLAVVISGLILDFPNIGEWTRSDMQTANIVHAIGAILLLGLSFGHIYMGTLGVEGAYESMKTGYVDETWAKEHHEIWYQDIKAGKSGHP